MTDGAPDPADHRAAVGWSCRRRGAMQRRGAAHAGRSPRSRPPGPAEHPQRLLDPVLPPKVRTIDTPSICTSDCRRACLPLRRRRSRWRRRPVVLPTRWRRCRTGCSRGPREVLNLKLTAYSEGQIGWLPYMLESVDDVWSEHRPGAVSLTHPGAAVELLHRQVFGLLPGTSTV